MKLLLAILIAFVPLTLFGQETTPDIVNYLARIDKGEADRVRAEIPSLLSQYPNNPGVLYLQGVLTTDGTEAVRIYQSIVDNFPRSEWADDALFKVYQFYYAIGLYRTAEIKLAQLKKDYPQSKFIAGAGQSDTRGIPEEKLAQDTTKSEETIATQTQSTAEKSDPANREALAPSPGVSSRAQYTLQVGAYSQQENAEKQKLFFEDLGYSVEVINKVRNSRSLFVVLVGEYMTPDDAKEKSGEFKRKYNINSMVVTK